VSCVPAGECIIDFLPCPALSSGVILHAPLVTLPHTHRWSQWASSRTDLFPADFCHVMESLTDQAPAHSFRQTRREVEAAYGVPLESMFTNFDPKPLASGSIAQVTSIS
jgi:aarF domain-containing kinase